MWHYHFKLKCLDFLACGFSTKQHGTPSLPRSLWSITCIFVKRLLSKAWLINQHFQTFIVSYDTYTLLLWYVKVRKLSGHYSKSYMVPIHDYKPKFISLVLLKESHIYKNLKNITSYKFNIIKLFNNEICGKFLKYYIRKCVHLHHSPLHPFISK